MGSHSLFEQGATLFSLDIIGGLTKVKSTSLKIDIREFPNTKYFQWQTPLK